ncbi:MAG: hypothetical protein PHX04_00825 [Bacilli bacterium]|nr:hypothetical protein [Bacilli bacterium]
MIKVITGPMFSGKSDELLDEYNKKYHKSKILLFKPFIDTRDYGIIKTRCNKEVKAILIKDLKDIKKYLNKKITTIFIDEANLLTGNVQILLDLSIKKDIDIFIAGLNQTSEQEPFGIMPEILAVADQIVTKKASCNDCNRDAIYSYYDGKKVKTVLVGNENYIALCSNCLKKRKSKNGRQK